MAKYEFKANDLVVLDMGVWRNVVSPLVDFDAGHVYRVLYDQKYDMVDLISSEGRTYPGCFAERFTLAPQGAPIIGNVSKDPNPKDAIATKKVPFSVVPLPVMAEVGVGMQEGARKYGRHNWRVSEVSGSVYFDATMRHLFAWWEGEDIDPDSGLSHVTKAITSLVVLRDAMIQGKFKDDRPPSSPEGWLKDLQPKVDEIFERIPNAVPSTTKQNS